MTQISLLIILPATMTKTIPPCLSIAVTTPDAMAVPLRGRRLLAICVWIMASVVATLCTAQPPPPVAPVRPPSAPPVPRPITKPATAKPATATPPAAAPPAKAKPAAVPPPRGAANASKMKMESLELLTKDNVKLRAFYFPSDKGKDAVPVIILHEWQGQASPYSTLVRALWEAGCAVIVPEFRGHGDSREYEIGGRKREFDVARMGRSDVANIIGGDMEAVKKFLREENNADRLNLNALVLVGVREGAVIAAQWAVGDLNFPSVGSIKQGQDVKALVLVSPEKILKGFSLDETLQDRLLWQLPFMIVVGQGSPQFEEADRFHKRLETMKKRAGRGTAEGLFFQVVPTSLAGPALVNEVPGVIDKIAAFVKTELVDNVSKIPWVKRE